MHTGMGTFHYKCKCSEFELRIAVHGPEELGQQALVEHLFNGHLVALAPGHCDAGVQIVNLTRSQGDGLQVVLHLCIDLRLGYLLLLPADFVAQAAAKRQKGVSFEQCRVGM